MTPKVGRRVPRHLRKIVPACIASIIFILYLSSAGAFSQPSSSSYSGGLAYRSASAVPRVAGKFPKKIWQTWKVDALDFEEKDLLVARSWTSKNPGHRYEVLTDQNDLHYVEEHFGPDGLNRPDIVHTFRELTAQIVKADLLRYLVMYVDGGLYADIDVEALKPIDKFIPDRFDEKDINMVVGIEVDEPEFKNHAVLGKKSKSFCQWTFMCKPGQPVVMRLIDNIIKWLNDIAKRQNVPISRVKLDFDDVISGTGPSAFTEAILAEMATRTGTSVSWDTFHNLLESKLVGGVLVLTVEAFAAGQGHSDSGNHGSKTALAKHHYHASGWPNLHPRYKHPIYGEVERCNWNHACVKDWDEKTAAFENLSDEEKARRLAAKQVSDAFKIQNSSPP